MYPLSTALNKTCWTRIHKWANSSRGTTEQLLRLHILSLQGLRGEVSECTCKVRAHSWSLLDFDSGLVCTSSIWGCWQRSAEWKENSCDIITEGVTQDTFCVFVCPLSVAQIPFCCLVALATCFITTPSMPFLMSVGEAETKLNSSQLSAIFCSTFSSSAARPARSISWMKTLIVTDVQPWVHSTNTITYTITTHRQINVDRQNHPQDLCSPKCM